MRSIALLLLTFFPALALADDFATSQDDYVAVYSGLFDITQSDNSAVQFGAEYRFADIYHGLRPAIGGNVTTDGALYGYGGFFWDVPLTERIIFTPNFVAGAYSDGDGKDLHHAIEFRSGLELSYQFEQGSRLGVGFNHISNASLGDHNPGAETLLLVYQLPLGR